MAWHGIVLPGCTVGFGVVFGLSVALGGQARHPFSFQSRMALVQAAAWAWPCWPRLRHRLPSSWAASSSASPTLLAGPRK